MTGGLYSSHDVSQQFDTESENSESFGKRTTPDREDQDSTSSSESDGQRT